MGGGRERRGRVGAHAGPRAGAEASASPNDAGPHAGAEASASPNDAGPRAGAEASASPNDAGPRAGAWPSARRLAAWAWTLAICVFLWMPPPPPPEIVWPWWDSLVHTGLFAGFGVLWTWRGLGSARVLVLGACLGVLTELGQALVPWERHASWDDLAFDVLGVALGWIAVGGAWRKRA